MAIKATKEEPPKFEYDYIVLYHLYSHKKPKELGVKKADLAAKVAELMDDGTIQYITVYRDRSGKPRGHRKIWVGG